MFTFLIILSIVVFFKLVIVAAMRSHGAPIKNRSAVHSLLQIFQAFLISFFTLIVTATFGWLLGSIIVIIALLVHGSIGRMPFVSHIAQRLYAVYQPYLIAFSRRYPKVLSIVSIYTIEDERAALQFESREALQELIATSVGILSASEKKLIRHSLAFSDQLVSSIMTPRDEISSISKSEFLGPLALDDLHKTGHTRLPVIDGDIDHVIGMLYLQNLLTLDSKHSVTAEKAMEPRVFYIREDQTLQHALAAFLRTQHHLIIVINEYRETVGLLTLEDVIEALLGQKIIDEFDSHEDKAMVALRNLHDKYEPKNHEDV